MKKSRVPCKHLRVVDAMTRPRAAYRPDPAMRDHYNRRYHAYCGLADTLRSFWAEQAAGPAK